MSESTCTIEDCDRVVIARGWCKGHYSRWRRHGDPLGGPPLRKSTHAPGECVVPECDRKSRTLGLCPLHYGRWRVNGTTALLRDTSCSVSDCAKRAFSEGLCRTHWERWKKFGDPDLCRQCIIDGCSRFAPAGKRGWCVMHYTRWSRHNEVGGLVSRAWQPPREPADGHWWCTTCRAEFPLKDFQRDKNAPAGISRVCRDCIRDRRIAEYYGITGAQYKSLLNEQGGVCWTCGKPETGKHQSGTLRRLSVDHDHKCCPGKKSCGKCVRGLLCSRCNSAIGLIGDNLTVLESMAVYLKREPVPWVEPAEPGKQGALWANVA